MLPLPHRLAVGFACLLTFRATDSLAQQPSALDLPPGMTLPVALTHGVKAGETPAGTPITGLITQRVPLGTDDDLPHKCKVEGRVVNSSSAELSLAFTTLHCPNATIPIRTLGLAIASGEEADATREPADGGTDRGNPNPASWTTRQVGGDQVARSGWKGEVVNQYSHRVGFADFHGVYTDPPPDASGAAAVPHAMGVFATTARGLYGFAPETTFDGSGGLITLRSPHGPQLRRGDNVLLQLLPSSP